MKTTLVTGAAGFIGSSLIKKIISKNNLIIGIDNFNDNYNPIYKKENIRLLKNTTNFKFYKADILDTSKIETLFSKYNFHTVIHLAALTGVRTSIKYPKKYQQVNTYGTKNIYQIAQKNNVKLFVFSSSSSVYGNSHHIPFTENQKLYPQSPYAKSKYDAEILLHKMNLNYKLPTLIFRFFSVYGPNGRPDMAPYLFTQAAYSKQNIYQYGKGNTARDYTYIDDITRAIKKSIKLKLSNHIINLGNSSPIKLSYLINTIEKITKSKINIGIQPLNKSESLITYANIQKAKKLLNWQPKTKFEVGMNKFIQWYLQCRK